MPKTSPDAPDGGPTITFHDLIILAVEALNGGRKGSSVQAIKKHILIQYGVEVSVKNNHHFKRGLETALEEEFLIRVTGVGGATGSFRLPSKSKKKSPTASNATTRTSRKKSPPTNVDDVTFTMNNMTMRATEQPGTFTGATKTRAKGKMVADDPGEIPSTRKPVINAATARARTPAPSSSKGKNKNLQPSAATSRTATAKTQPVASRSAAVKATDDDNESDVSPIEVLRANQDSTQTEDEEDRETYDEIAPGNHTATDDDIDSEDQVATENERATEDEAGAEEQVSTGNEQVTEDEDAQEDGDGTKDENVMQYTDDDEEKYDANQNVATTFYRSGRAALGNEETTLRIPNTDDEDEESEVEESEDDESEDEGTGSEGMEDEGSAADDKDEDPYRFVFIRVPDEDEYSF